MMKSKSKFYLTKLYNLKIKKSRIQLRDYTKNYDIKKNQTVSIVENHKQEINNGHDIMTIKPHFKSYTKEMSDYQ